MFRFISITLIAIAVGSSGAAATTFDAVADFSAASNPSGPWSYGYQTSSAGPFIGYGSHGNFGGIDFWYLSGTGLPDLGLNSSGGPAGFTPDNTLEMSPGNTAALADYASVLRWTTPDAGFYSIDVTFTGIDPRGIDTLDSVYIGGTSAFSAALSFTGDTTHYASALALAAGETIDFIVANNGTAGNKNFTSIVAQISDVPEPGTLVLFPLGLAFFAALRHRKRRVSNRRFPAWFLRRV